MMNIKHSHKETSFANCYFFEEIFAQSRIPHNSKILA